MLKVAINAISDVRKSVTSVKRTDRELHLDVERIANTHDGSTERNL